MRTQFPRNVRFTNTRDHFRTGLIPALCVLLVATFVYHPATVVAQASHTTNDQGLDITLALDKTHVVVGEPIVMTITMENGSRLPMVTLDTNFQLPEGNNVDVTIQPPHELPYRYSGAVEIGSYPSIQMSLISGRPQSIDILLLADNTQPSGLIFPTPGNYKMSVAFSFNINKSPSSKTVTLPLTQIQVDAATGAAKEALNAINTPDLVRALHLAAPPTTSALEIISSVAERYPGTSLGALALRAEGMRYARGPNPKNVFGARLLQKYLANDVAAVDKDGIVWSIAAAYFYAKKYDASREWVFYLLRNYPTSVRIRPEDALLYYFYYEPMGFAAKAPWYLLKEPWVVPGAEPPADLRSRESGQNQ